MRLDKDWAIRGHKFAYPGRKDTIKACIYVKELVRFMLWKVEEGVNTDLTDFWTCAVLGKVTQIAQMTLISSSLFYVPQISQINTDLCPMRAGISQMVCYRLCS